MFLGGSIRQSKPKRQKIFACTRRMEGRRPAAGVCTGEFSAQPALFEFVPAVVEALGFGLQLLLFLPALLQSG